MQNSAQNTSDRLTHYEPLSACHWHKCSSEFRKARRRDCLGIVICLRPAQSAPGWVGRRLSTSMGFSA